MMDGDHHKSYFGNHLNSNDTVAFLIEAKSGGILMLSIMAYCQNTPLHTKVGEGGTWWIHTDDNVARHQLALVINFKISKGWSV